MTNRVIDQTVVWIFLGTMLVIWFGCGGSDDSNVDKPTMTEDVSTDDSSIDKPPMVEDAPVDNANVDKPPMVEDSPADDLIIEVAVGSLQGQVTRIEGTQIHIRVLQNGDAVASVQANPDGSYQIDDIKPGTYIVQITAQDHKAVEQTVQVRAGEISTLANVALEALEAPATHIRGLVLDQQTNTSLNGVRVQLIDRAGDVREALTKQTGSFEFENVPAGQQFTLIIDIQRYEKQEIAIDPISEGEVVKLEVGLVPINIDELPIGDGLQVGVAAPAFDLPDQDGKRRALADYAGQKVVLVFDRGRW